jgi:acetyl esterase/lipase
MSTRHLVDPDLLPVLDAMPANKLDAETLPLARQGMDAFVATLPIPDLPVIRTEVTITGAKGAPIRALLFTPATVKTAAAILHIHSGGYVLGTPDMNVPDLVYKADRLGCIILSVDYRLAPETRHPGPLEDCYAALAWLHDQAAALGFDPARIAVIGESAGGGLAAALCLLARDRGAYPIAFQLLEAPMIDDRSAIGQGNPATGEFIWTRSHNHFGWSALLGTAPGSPDVPPYAAAARATDLSGLPPTFIAVGALDLFLDEDMDYARRLATAGVPIELHVYPGAYHGFRMAGQAAITLRSRDDAVAALAKALGSPA